MASTIQTVLGPIPSTELGVTLPHEHFFVNTGATNLTEPEDPYDREMARQPVTRKLREWLDYNWHLNLDNLSLIDPDIARAEAVVYRNAGGRSVIDVTPWRIGQNPLGLAKLARETGLHIVMGCGYYWSASHPPTMATIPEADITAQIVKECTTGIGDTDIIAGVIGEIGCSYPLTPDEEKSLRAAGVAQTILGAALYIHPGKHPESPFEILKVLESTGADLSRVIMCHMDRTLQDLDRTVTMLQSGCTAEWDLFGMEITPTYYRPLGIDIPTDAQRLNQIRALIDRGFSKQILISHDICFKHRLHHYGGHGYDYILINTLPWMKQRGFTQEEIDTIVIHNPRRLIERNHS